MPAIKKPSNHFNATLYTGDGTSNRTITGTGFQPDWLWLKMRNDADDHVLVDSVRGGSKRIKSNSSDAESDISYPTLASDGFVVSSGVYNNSAKTFVAWQWNAGGSTVTNTSGSISAQVRANATAGFSVVTYTGTGANATVGHGLGVAPSFIIIKNRSSAENWICYHASLGNGNAMYLNITNASSVDTAWNNTSPTSTVFSLGSAATNANGSTNSLVAYCFAPIAGYSAFGSYKGNASTDGPFVYTGFRPRFVLMKYIAAGGDWYMYDSTRSPINVSTAALVSNSSAAEISQGGIDFLSNGFKLRASNNPNVAATYIYMAFAESPLKYANAR